jgi:hypothetical protein
MESTPLTVENFGEVLEKHLPSAFDKITAPSYNGSDIPKEKPIRNVVADLSENFRKQTINLATNTKRTDECYGLLQDKRNRQEAYAYIGNFFQSVNRIVPIGRIWKWVAAIIGTFTIITTIIHWYEILNK